MLLSSYRLKMSKISWPKNQILSNSKKHLDVKIGDSIVRIEYDILTDAITVRCDGNSFSFDTTENKYPIYKGIFDMGVDITPRDTNYLLFMLKKQYTNS